MNTSLSTGCLESSAAPSYPAIGRVPKSSTMIVLAGQCSRDPPSGTIWRLAGPRHPLPNATRPGESSSAELSTNVLLRVGMLGIVEQVLRFVELDEIACSTTLGAIDVQKAGVIGDSLCLLQVV